MIKNDLLCIIVLYILSYSAIVILILVKLLNRLYLILLRLKLKLNTWIQILYMWLLFNLKLDQYVIRAQINDNKKKHYNLFKKNLLWNLRLFKHTYMCLMY